MSTGTLDTEYLDAGAVVCLIGEHDLATADELRTRLSELRDQGRPIVVDLSQATFVDSAVVGVLVGEHERAAEAGIRLAVVIGDPPARTVQKLFELTRLDTVIPVAATRAEALANGSAP